MERSMLQGLAVFRWGAWCWVAAVLVVSRDDLARPWLGIGLVGLALAVTITDTVLLRRDPHALLRAGPVVAELIVGAALLLGDGWAYGPHHVFSNSQSLGSVWPLAGILATGVAFGPWVSASAGVAFGLARAGAVLANGEAIDTGSEVLSLASTAVFYALGGAVAGYVARFLRRAEQEISAARAREEVARTLHDGVLQTLALFERRVDDPDLARLARDQDRELREYLFGTARSVPGGGDLGVALRTAAARFERAYGGRVDVVVAEDLPELGDGVCDAMAGAVGEALTNAGKHGRASRVTVYLEPAEDGGIFCSVKDDGEGFDPAATPARVGLDRSIRGRVAEVGGRVDVQSRPGEGAEVCLWVPAR